MSGQILIGLGVLVLSVIIQAGTVVLLLRHLGKLAGLEGHRLSFSRSVFSLSVVMLVIFIGHLVQMGLWAELFLLMGEFTDFPTAFYHSAVNFASLGYGDIVMSEDARLLGAIEAGNGVLMFGLSAAAMYAVLTWMIRQSRGRT